MCVSKFGTGPCLKATKQTENPMRVLVPIGNIVTNLNSLLY